MESKQPNTAQQEVLSGWKDIAHYLGRGVRTVQRYERELGLPVRRPSGHPTSAVLAVKSELDSWVKLAPRWATASPEASQRPTQRAHLHTQMMTLRKELKANIRTLRESIAKVRQQLNETRKRQDSIESVIRQYSNVLHISPVDQKRHKPN